MKEKVVILSLLLLVVGCVTPPKYYTGQYFFAQGNYIEALRYYQVVLKEAQTASDREMIQKAIESTKGKIADDFLKRAAEAYSQSRPPTLQSINKAISMLQKGSPYENHLNRISKKIKEYSEEKDTILCEVQNLIYDAEKMMQKEEYFYALQALYKAQKKDKMDKQLSDKITDLENFIEGQKDLYFDQINKFLNMGNVDEAKNIYDKLVLMTPHHPKLSTLQEQIRDSERKQLISEILLLETQNKWLKAYQALKKSRLDGLDQEMARISRIASQYYYNKAKTYLKSGETHLAYIASVKAKEFNSHNVSIFQIHKECEDYIEKQIHKYIAIPTFDAPVNDPDAGKLFSDAIISGLFRTLPYGINIVEREKIDLLMNEKKMELKSIGNLLGVDMIITGNVSLLKVDHNISERMATTKVKIGEEERPNPEFTQMVNTYGKNIDKWPHKPPMTIKEDKFQLVKYKKGQVSMKAFADVSVRIFDTKKAAIVYAKDFQDCVGKSDEFQESVDGTDISEDPLELPTETEIKRELQNRVIDRILDVILKTFENREKRFLQWATFHIERKEYPEAIKFIAQGYLYSKRAKKDNRYSQKIYNLMVDLTEGD